MPENNLIGRISGVFTLFFFIFWGYSFGGGDHAEHLPLVLKWLNPNLFSKDYFVELASNSFTVRDPFVWLIGSFAKIFPLPYLVLAICVFLVYFQFYGWLKLAILVTKNEFRSIVLVLLTHFVFYKATIGGVQIAYTILISSLFAKAAVPWLWYSVINKKFIWVCPIIIFITWMHPLNGLQQSAIVVTLMLILYGTKESLKQSVKWIAIGILPLGFYAFLLVKNYELSKTFNVDKFAFIHYHIRNPHHFFIASNGKFATFLFFMVVVLSMFSVTKYHRNLPKWLITFWLILLSIFFLNLILFDLLKLYYLGKLQLYKFTIWLNWASVTVIVLTYLPKIEKYFLVLYSKNTIFLFAFLGVFFIFISGITSPIYFGNKYQFPWIRPTEKQEFFNWISENTPLNAVFLVPPHEDEFSYYSKRSMLIGTKAIIHNPSFMLKWYNDLQLIYGEESFTSLHQLSSAYNHKLVNSFEINKKPNFRLIHKPSCNYLQMLEKPIHESENWAIYKVN